MVEWFVFVMLVGASVWLGWFDLRNYLEDRLGYKNHGVLVAGAACAVMSIAVTYDDWMLVIFSPLSAVLPFQGTMLHALMAGLGVFMVVAFYAALLVYLVPLLVHHLRDHHGLKA